MVYEVGHLGFLYMSMVSVNRTVLISGDRAKRVSAASNAYISANFASRKPEDISFDWKFYLVSHNGRNSVRNTWNWLSCTHTAHVDKFYREPFSSKIMQIFLILMIHLSRMHHSRVMVEKHKIFPYSDSYVG